MYSKGMTLPEAFSRENMKIQCSGGVWVRRLHDVATFSPFEVESLDIFMWRRGHTDALTFKLLTRNRHGPPDFHVDPTTRSACNIGM